MRDALLTLRPGREDRQRAVRRNAHGFPRGGPELLRRARRGVPRQGRLGAGGAPAGGRSSKGSCGNWFQAPVNDALEAIRELLARHARDTQGPEENAVTLDSRGAANDPLRKEPTDARGLECTGKPPAGSWFSQKAWARVRKLATAMKKRAAPTAGTPSHDDLCMLQNSRIPGEVKIGRSTAVEQRRAHLQCSHISIWSRAQCSPGAGI